MSNDHGLSSLPALNPDEDYQLDQLVVDSGHLDTVAHMLAALGIGWAPLGPDDSDPDLGLTRLRDVCDGDGESLDVGELLGLIRQRAAAERDGWEPVIGKNRRLEAVIGEGHKPMSVSAFGHKPMAGADPQPATAQDVWASLAGEPDAGDKVRVWTVDTPLHPAASPDGTFGFRSGHGAFVYDLIKQLAPAADVQVDGRLVGESAQADSWDTALAIASAGRQRPDVLNLSLGCYTMSGGPPLVIARAIERLDPSILVITAAGNHGALVPLVNGRNQRSATWPAALSHPIDDDGVKVRLGGGPIAVGAANAHGAVAEWSPALPWVTCTAPGVDVVARYLVGDVRLLDDKVVTFNQDHGYATWSGTSFAAAIVSGAVAGRTKPGSVSPRQALEQLLQEKTLVRPF